jgi:predicted hotdog family 3-hydroxylacyl-ACP dehydratase
MAIDSVESLIPHRNRMRLVDEIIAVDEKMAVTLSTVTENWPMVEAGSANCLVLVELVAQTAGVCLGWRERRKTAEDLEGSGWIVGVKEAVFHCRALPLNSRILTESKKVFQMEFYSEIEGSTRMGDEILAEIKLQVVQSGSNIQEEMAS